MRTSLRWTILFCLLLVPWGQVSAQEAARGGDKAKPQKESSERKSDSQTSSESSDVEGRIYRIYLEDGRVFLGVLRDLGNRWEISFQMGDVKGAIQVLKRQVLRIEPCGVIKRPKRYRYDLIITYDGRKIEGKILRKDKLRVYLKIPIDEQKKSFATIALFRRDIRLIVPAEKRRELKWKERIEEALGPSSAEISKDLEKSLWQAVRKLESPNLETVAQGRERLLVLGVFALPIIKQYLERQERKHRELEVFLKNWQEFPGAVTPLLLVSLRLRKLLVYQSIVLCREILGINEVKKLVTPEMEKKIPNVYARLASISPAIRFDVLREMVLYTPNSAPPILEYFVNKEKETPEIKAFCIAQLGILGENKRLLKLYHTSSGQVKFAAALALGDNGVFLGIPTIIDALTIENVKIRKLAIQKLREYTQGEFFGFFPEDPPEKRREAVKRWRQWWAKVGPKIVQNSLEGTILKHSIPRRRKQQGIQNWHLARTILEGALKIKDPKKRALEIDRGIYYLKKAIEFYPAFVQARFTLALLLYQYKKDYKEAQWYLRQILTLYRKEAGEVGRQMAHYHLGNIHALKKEWDNAIFRYQKVLLLNPDHVDAYIALGSVYFQKAVSDAKRSPQEIRELYEKALQAYQDALKAMERQSRQIAQARLPQDPNWVLIKNAFRKITFGDYTRSSRKKRAYIHYRMALIYFALNKRAVGILELRKARKWDPQNRYYEEVLKYWESQKD